jgi:two-component system, cell cycle response regulator DivK
MSSQSLSERHADLRHFSRLLVERAGDYEARVEEFLAAAEGTLEHAEAALHAAYAGDVYVSHFFSGHALASFAGAVTARQLRLAARQQHAAARQFLADVERGERAHERRANAVLVVDDHDELRELIANVLQQAGFVVRTAVNGLEGLIAAYDMRPGVIVMDVAMPILDGIEATRLIKASEATRDARVIAYTGEPSLESRSVHGLFAAVLTKPAHVDLVVATVQQMASV